MNREHIIQYMNTQSTPEMMIGIVQEYIKERTSEIWRPKNINLIDLQIAYEYAIMWYCKTLHVNILRDKENNVIKIF